MAYSLPTPNGRGGMIICGMKAFHEFEKVASHAAQRAGIQRRVSRRTIRRSLSEILVGRFMIEGRDINTKQVEKVISAAAKHAIRSCSNRIHFVPCHLMATQEPSELILGPISFLSRKKSKEFLRQKLKDERAKSTAASDRKLMRSLLFDSINYYRAFDWTAKIEIKGCDDELGEEIAKRAATSALDCLQLILGGEHSDKMKVGGPRIWTDRRAKLAMTSDGSLTPSISTSWMGQIGFHDGWSKLLVREDFQAILTLCGTALEVAVDPDLDRPFSRRFLDATSWFGEAVREDSLAASIVKYVTALERMLMTEERDDIGRLLAERLSAMCLLSYEGQKGKNRQQWFDETKKVYSLRSKIVHGSMSPDSPHVIQGVYSCMKLPEAALLCAISMAGPRGLLSEKIEAGGLAGWFDLIVADADRIEKVVVKKLGS
jgi:hypothetical protein